MLDSRLDLLNYLVATKHYQSFLAIDGHPDGLFEQVAAVDRTRVAPCDGDGTGADDFFRKSTDEFDLVFIGGVHDRKQVLRDVQNALRCLRNGGCIVVHGCLPIEERHQSIPRSSRAWVGDVWKAVVEIRTWERVDLAVLNADWGMGILFKRPNEAPLAAIPPLTWSAYVAGRDHLLRVCDEIAIRNFVHLGEAAPSTQCRLEIPRIVSPRAAWVRFLIRCLSVSSVFEVIRSDLPTITENRRWTRHFCVLRTGEVAIGLDTWDDELPSSLGHELFRSLDLLLKIQHVPCPFWDDVQRRWNLPVSAWTMFGYDEFPVGYFNWADGDRKLLCAFSGDIKRPKRRWVEHMRQRGYPVLSIQSRLDYLTLIRQMRWGIILQGKRGQHCDGKNRREHAYTSCGIPLALNYQPHYPFPMKPGVDYVYLRTPEDIDALADIDPRPFAKASERLWRDCFSPMGMANTLLKLAASTGARPCGIR